MFGVQADEDELGLTEEVVGKEVLVINIIVIVILIFFLEFCIM